MISTLKKYSTISISGRIRENQSIASKLEQSISLIDSYEENEIFYKQEFVNLEQASRYYDKYFSSKYQSLLHGYNYLLLEDLNLKPLKFQYHDSGSFEFRINEILQEYKNTGDIKLLNEIRKLRGEYKAALLEELRKKLKKVKRIIKLLFRLIEAQFVKDKRHIIRKIIQFLFKNLDDENDLKLSFYTNKYLGINFKLFNHEKNKMVVEYR